MSRLAYDADTILGRYTKALALVSCLTPCFITTAIAQDSGFTVIVNGEHVDGDKLSAKQAAKVLPKSPAMVLPEDAPVIVAASVHDADLDVKFDGLDVTPILNVSTTDLRRAYRAGEAIEFNATTNYPAFIDHAEIRILKGGDDTGRKQTLLETIDVVPNSTASWTMPDVGDAQLTYVLRVYDSRGRFDETKPLTLSATERETERHDIAPKDAAIISAGEGEDRTAIRNIRPYGASVTVHGRKVPDNARAIVMGETIPVDADGSFVVQRILPPGEHDVDVAVDDGVEQAAVSRILDVPANDFFHVALADITLGYRLGSTPFEAVDPDEFEQVYTKGRLAFYLKGKIKGRYILTAAADTGEESLKSLFKGFDEKDPTALLRRIDPDKYYPVYGDDSTAVEDAPTQGKFYVKLEDGDSHVMWGNYKVGIDGGTYLRSERALYGAHALYRSADTTEFGERKASVELYAAQPGTLPQRDLLQGTAGSAYFLSRRDITIGSETISIEIVDPVSGRVTDRVTLSYGEDYTIDYVQGVVILKRPLSSIVRDTGAVRATYDLQDVARLAVQYEYTPGVGEVDGYSYGGRAEAWLGEHVRVGVTAMSEKTSYDGDSADQLMGGADLYLRATENTWAKAEIAATRGPGFGFATSTDGGLTINNSDSSGISGKDAIAWRIEAQVELADISSAGPDGRIGAYYEEREAGFATLDHNVSVDERLGGIFLEIEPTDKSSIRLAYDHYSNDNGRRDNEYEAEFTSQFAERWEATIGVSHLDRVTPGGATTENGSRTDVGGKLAYKPNDDSEIYVFGQKTVARRGLEANDRIGAGGSTKLSEKVGVEGEVSYGTKGWGGLAALTYDPTADDHYYLGYQLDPGRELDGQTLYGTDLGGIVLGARRRFNDDWTAFTENNYDMFGQRRALTSVYGISYTPDAMWTIDGGFEYGHIYDPNDVDFERKAVSLGMSYKDGEKISFNARGEARFEESQDGTRNRNTYLFASDLAYQSTPTWRLLGSVDLVLSESEQSDLRDGDYVEASIGYAYRPIDNDNLNVLFKYTFLYDLPGADQVNAYNDLLGPRQRSHVLSADATWAVNNYLRLGAKYGFRIGEVETSRGSGDFEASSAHLGILRADLHVVHNWDLLLEGRILHSPSARTTDYGALAAVYRHFGKNMKAGIGYNFGRFSDDLTDLTHDDQGIFLNVVGKF